MLCALKMTRQLILFDRNSAIREIRCNPVRINNNSASASIIIRSAWIQTAHTYIDQNKTHTQRQTPVASTQKMLKTRKHFVKQLEIMYRKTLSFGAKFENCWKVVIKSELQHRNVACLNTSLSVCAALVCC